MSTAQLPATAPTSAASGNSIAYTGWIALGVVAALVMVLFGSSFINLFGLWSRDANYSHGYLVAPISLILALQHLPPSWAPHPRRGRIRHTGHSPGHLLPVRRHSRALATA